MPEKTPLPASRDAWIKQLDAVRLPVSTEHHALVRRTLGDSRKTLREIADLLQGSPAIVLEILREANRHGGGLAERAESLDVALTRLGLKRAEALVQRMPVLPETEIPHALRQLQLVSQHATGQANGLFASRLARLWQEIHWSSLLFLAPMWTLAARHPSLFEEWERRVLANDEPPARVEQQLLGTSLMALCLALAERWRLPEWIGQGYRLLVEDRRLLVSALHVARDHDHPLVQQQRLDADPVLRRWLTQPANTILLANSLALSAHHAWDSEHSLRWQRLTGLYLNLELGDVQQQVHQLAIHSARQLPHSDLWHPAQSLLWPWSARRLAATAPALAKSSPPSSVGEWRERCAVLLREPTPFSNVLQLCIAAREALEACGLSRLLLCLVDRGQTQLLAQQQAGLPAEAATLRIEIGKSALLKKLVAQPAQLRLSPDNALQFSALLPGTLKALFDGEHLVLRSIGNGGRVVMLLVADQGGGPMDSQTLQLFGKTVQCIERALTRFTTRKA